MGIRHVYLVRHGDAGDERELTDIGHRQVEALAERLATVEFCEVRHGPLARAAQTAQLIGALLPGVPVREDEAAGDYLPPVPEPVEEPYAGLVGSYTPEERAAGAVLATDAVARFTRAPADGHENLLVVTHSFLVAWFVRHALGAPDARWLGLNVANAGLTVVRCQTGRPCRLFAFNDVGHLEPDLRWTGFPPDLRI